MTVSTATYAYKGGTFVTATGSLAEVMGELRTGTSSKCVLEHREDIITPPQYSAATGNVMCIWFSRNTSDWS